MEGLVAGPLEPAPRGRAHRQMLPSGSRLQVLKRVIIVRTSLPTQGGLAGRVGHCNGARAMDHAPSARHVPRNL
jgi:hypothetical protein